MKYYHWLFCRCKCWYSQALACDGDNNTVSWLPLFLHQFVEFLIQDFPPVCRGAALWLGWVYEEEKRVRRERRYCGEHRISQNPSHILFPEFDWLPSGRRFRCPGCRTQRKRTTYSPEVSSSWMLNSQMWKMQSWNWALNKLLFMGLMCGCVFRVLLCVFTVSLTSVY